MAELETKDLEEQEKLQEARTGKKRVRQILVTMRCPRCTNSFTIPIPGGPVACMYCARPWFWPFVSICDENEEWAKDFIATQEAKFRDIKETPTGKAKARGALVLEDAQVTPV